MISKIERSTGEVLALLGYDSNRIAELARARIVAPSKLG